ncbi:MAG: nucleotidyltransferase family protein [Candidatus Nanopelagicales bacterium]
MEINLRTSVTAGIVLAAGAGTRYGQPKAPVEVDGERLVDRAVRVLQEAGCFPIAVVLGAWVGEVPGAVVVENPDWASGMGSSLREGLRWAQGTDATSVVVTLVDLPGLTSMAVSRIVDEPADLVSATFDGQRGHPVKFGRDHWAALIDSASGDTGARDYLRAREDLVLVEVSDVADGQDLDTPIA